MSAVDGRWNGVIRLSGYEKVGRLLPRPDNRVGIIRDGHGEIGSVTKRDLGMVLMGLGPALVCPDGEVTCSESARSIRVSIPGHSVVYMAFVRQVRGMIERWPTRKAAMFISKG